MSIKKVDTFPEITRTGRTSAELQMIIDSLVTSSKNGEAFQIENVQEGKKFNSLQQRIRAQAKKLNLKVTIHYDRKTTSLFFKVQTDTNKKPATSVQAKDVKSVKTNSKTNA